MSQMDLDTRWLLWKESLSGEDSNSIFNQISMMVWDTAVYRLILKSRETQIKEHQRLPGLNVRFHMLIDRNYFEVQAMGIRRLIDRFPLDGMKGVYSLGGLIKDIEEYQQLLTREKYLGFHSDQDLFEEFGFDEANQRFDKLSGKNANERNKDDLIIDSMFTKANEIIVSCKKIHDYVDKFIAHSATPQSRELINADEIKITLGQVWSAHKNLYCLAQFILGSLYGAGFSALPWENPSMFETENIPVIGTDTISEYKEIWEEYRKETNGWQLEEFELA